MKLEDKLQEEYERAFRNFVFVVREGMMDYVTYFREQYCKASDRLYQEKYKRWDYAKI
jgi:hypothetical protein